MPLSPFSSDPSSADEEEAQENWEDLLRWAAAAKGRDGRPPYLHWVGVTPRSDDPPGTRRGASGCVLTAAGIFKENESLAKANLLCEATHSPRYTWCPKCRSKLIRSFREAVPSHFP